MTKYKLGLNCPACGLPTMTKMQMIQDILRWTGQKEKSKYSDAQLTAEQTFWIWKALKPKS